MLYYTPGAAMSRRAAPAPASARAGGGVVHLPSLARLSLAARTAAPVAVAPVAPIGAKQRRRRGNAGARAPRRRRTQEDLPTSTQALITGWDDDIKTKILAALADDPPDFAAVCGGVSTFCILQSNLCGDDDMFRVLLGFFGSVPTFSRKPPYLFQKWQRLFFDACFAFTATSSEDIWDALGRIIKPAMRWGRKYYFWFTDRMPNPKTAARLIIVQKEHEVSLRTMCRMMDLLVWVAAKRTHGQETWKSDVRKKFVADWKARVESGEAGPPSDVSNDWSAIWTLLWLRGARPFQEVDYYNALDVRLRRAVMTSNAAEVHRLMLTEADPDQDLLFSVPRHLGLDSTAVTEMEKGVEEIPDLEWPPTLLGIAMHTGQYEVAKHLLRASEDFPDDGPVVIVDQRNRASLTNLCVKALGGKTDIPEDVVLAVLKAIVLHPTMPTDKLAELNIDMLKIKLNGSFGSPGHLRVARLISRMMAAEMAERANVEVTRLGAATPGSVDERELILMVDIARSRLVDDATVLSIMNAVFKHCEADNHLLLAVVYYIVYAERVPIALLTQGQADALRDFLYKASDKDPSTLDDYRRWEQALRDAFPDQDGEEDGEEDGGEDGEEDGEEDEEDEDEEDEEDGEEEDDPAGADEDSHMYDPD